MIIRFVVLAGVATGAGTLGWLVARRAGGASTAARVDPAALALPDPEATTLVFFGHVDCHTCPETLAAVEAAVRAAPDVRLRIVEYAEEPDLFGHYSVGSVPTMFLLTPGGDVLWARAGHPRGEELRRALARG